MNEDEPENKRFFYHAEFENEEAKRKVNPYSLRKRLHEESGLLIKNLTTDSDSGFSFEVVTQEEAEMFEKVTQINKQICNIRIHRFLNQSKGNIYIQQFEFAVELIENLLEAYRQIQES